MASMTASHDPVNHCIGGRIGELDVKVVMPNVPSHLGGEPAKEKREDA